MSLSNSHPWMISLSSIHRSVFPSRHSIESSTHKSTPEVCSFICSF